MRRLKLFSYGAEVFAEGMSQPASALPELPSPKLPGGYPPINASTALPRAQGLSPMKGNSCLGQTLHFVFCLMVTELSEGSKGRLVPFSIRIGILEEPWGRARQDQVEGGKTSICGALLCPRFFPHCL